MNTAVRVRILITTWAAFAVIAIPATAAMDHYSVPTWVEIVVLMPLWWLAVWCVHDNVQHSARKRP